MHYFSTVQKCIELISRAKKPVILLGSQATLPPTPIEDLRKALEVYIQLKKITSNVQVNTSK